MSKFITTRSMMALAGILLMVAIFSFSTESSGTAAPQGAECRVSDEDLDENELFWETLSRQFSGSVATY